MRSGAGGLSGLRLGRMWLKVVYEHVYGADAPVGVYALLEMVVVMVGSEVPELWGMRGRPV